MRNDMFFGGNNLFLNFVLTFHDYTHFRYHMYITDQKKTDSTLFVHVSAPDCFLLHTINANMVQFESFSKDN